MSATAFEVYVSGERLSATGGLDLSVPEQRGLSRAAIQSALFWSISDWVGFVSVTRLAEPSI